MGNLIDVLQKEHIEILTKFEEINRDDNTIDDKIKMVIKIKGDLFAHLNKEDMILYKSLESMLGENQEAEKILLKSITDEHKEITLLVYDFYNRINDIDNINEINSFINTVIARIKKEENILFQSFKKIFK